MSNGIPDNLRCASLAQVNDIAERVAVLEARPTHVVLNDYAELNSKNLEIAALRRENSELRKQHPGLDLCERTTLENYRKVIKSLNLNGPGAIRKYVRSLEDAVQHLNAQIVDLEDARLTEDW